MKLEQLFITLLVCVAFFTGGMIFLGEGIITSKFRTDEAPEFTKVDELDAALQTAEQSQSEEVFTPEDPGQTDENLDLSEIGFWSYSGRALKAVGYEAGAVNPSKSAFNEVLGYLKVNPIVIFTIASVLTVMIISAFVAFWKKRP